MTNFCTNCGTKLRKEDKFCTNCGTKIITDGNYCTKCGNKIRKEDNFCTNCGNKITQSDVTQNNHSSRSAPDSIEKEEKKKSKIDDEIFKSEEIKPEIRKNNIAPKVRPIREKEKISKKIEANERTYGGYCGFNCKHYYEEIIDGDGGVTADYEEDMCGVFYYCNLDHSLVEGRFCEDYE
ncbi:zinc ribbon domain-containing protein [Methanobrevibacter sp.]|uniref:zinc ribbon domain-containing protein n=1 Tax=Methanobrevibacter sp. TaxID=66852 RepID=UPI0025D83EC2|nr:zinc ribbon domain-containing protein [Methanobrevibacter sp.]MBR4448214.1 zinc ribbon domain-containing protein [Methanobrevibacter sp.]